ncbi:MAG: hypothetical protein WCQ95_07815 [Bacteroidota bacterium]
MGFLFQIAVHAQVNPLNQAAEEIQKQEIENYSEQTQSEIDISDMVANLEYYQKHPINLNHTDYEELAGLGLLNDIQINNLLEHIKNNGKLLIINELQTIDGFDSDLIALLLPYVFVSIPDNSRVFNFNDIFKFGTHQLMYRYQRTLQPQKGYASVSDSVRQLSPNYYYLGSPDKMYLKYRFNYFNNVKIGLTAEKDAGEQFFKGSNPYGFDFYSAYININNVGILKNAVVGDYSLQFGQGLTLWTGTGFGKGVDAVGIKKIARGITPNNSVYENGYMRGLAFTLAYKHFELTAFYSRKKIDGNLINDSLDNAEMYISSLPEDGLHNTELSIAKKHSVGEQILGGHLAYKTRALSIGITTYATALQAPLFKEYQPYNQFQFSGARNTNIGINYSYIFRNVNLYGETSLSQNGALATINGIMASISKYVSLVVCYRHYPRNYQSLYSAAFSQSNNSFNESGFYTGMVIKPHYQIQLSAYADIYHYPWLKYQVNAPSRGYDFNLSLQYKPTKKIQIDLRYKFENSEKNSDDAAAAIITWYPSTIKTTVSISPIPPPMPSPSSTASKWFVIATSKSHQKWAITFRRISAIEASKAHLQPLFASPFSTRPPTIPESTSTKTMCSMLTPSPCFTTKAYAITFCCNTK